jgi:hypothetical protein
VSTFEYLGFFIAVCSGWAVFLMIVAMLCILSNRVTHVALDACGGWKTFLKYREWYMENEVKK